MSILDERVRGLGLYFNIGATEAKKILDIIMKRED